MRPRGNSGAMQPMPSASVCFRDCEVLGWWTTTKPSVPCFVTFCHEPGG